MTIQPNNTNSTPSNFSQILQYCLRILLAFGVLVVGALVFAWYRTKPNPTPDEIVLWQGLGISLIVYSFQLVFDAIKFLLGQYSEKKKSLEYKVDQLTTEVKDLKEMLRALSVVRVSEKVDNS